MGQAYLGSVAVGTMPLGYGDMTGSESVFSPAPASGACCHGANCTIEDEDACVASIGLFLGQDQACDPNPCGPTGVPVSDAARPPRIYWDPSTEQGIAIFDSPGGPATAQLQVFDLRGRRIYQTAKPVVADGEQRLDWDGWSADGQRVPSGVYFVRIQVGAAEYSGRFVILR
jgi:hypothetical protein